MKYTKFLFLIFFPAILFAQEEAYILKNVSYKPGQKLFIGIAGKELGAPILIQVTDVANKSAINIPIIFEIVEKPSKSKGEMLQNKIVRTDSSGIAENYFTLGDQPGDYIIIARTEKMSGDTPVVLVRAQRTLWWLFLAFGLFGGLGIFLYGMSLGSGGLQKIAGERLRNILSILTSNRFIGLLIGIIVTAIVQSSSATSVMVVGLVSSSLMTLTQAIGVLMGAHIGTTITVQLIAFNISDYSLFLVGTGFLITLVTKRKFYIYTGEIILGFGFIFFGMAVMSQAIYPLKSMPTFSNWLIEFGDKPILGILFSTIFTGIIQSSGATIGLCVVLAGEGLLSFESAMPLVFGANIGTCVTALLSSIGASISGKRAAVAHTLFSVIGVVIFTPFLEQFEKLVLNITNLMGTDAVPRQIANGHMFFNIINAGILISFVPATANLITRLIPEKAGEEEFRPKYLNNAYLETPALALQQAHLEETRLISIGKKMYGDLMQLFEPDNEENVAKMRDYMKNVNFLEHEIRKYLTRLSQKSISLQQSRRLMRILLTIDDLRHIAERMGDNISELAEKLVDNNWKFSDEGRKEIIQFYLTIGERLQVTLTALENENKNSAEDIIRTKHKISEQEIQLRQSHIERLQRGLAETLTTSTIHLDLLTALKRIDTFCVKISHEIIEQYNL